MKLSRRFATCVLKSNNDENSQNGELTITDLQQSKIYLLTTLKSKCETSYLHAIQDAITVQF